MRDHDKFVAYKADPKKKGPIHRSTKISLEKIPHGGESEDSNERMEGFKRM